MAPSSPFNSKETSTTAIETPAKVNASLIAKEGLETTTEIKNKLLALFLGGFG